MGTIINGNKWSGACVNGNVVNGLVKNGLVFYRKEIMPSVLYKRRIMTGDNLTGKRIYFSFPDDYATIRQDQEPIGDFIVGNGSETIWENSLYEILVGEYGYVYIPDMLNSPSILSNDIGNVTNIEDCLAYRCCYIEDPNIRPVQSTDVITKNTKFYFNFPDNLYEELIEYYYEIESDTFMIINNKNNDNMTFQVAYSPDVFFTISVHSRIGMEKSITDIYAYNEYTDFINESKLFFTETILNKYEGENFTIAELDTNSPIYKYILVDTTTLGN